MQFIFPLILLFFSQMSSANSGLNDLLKNKKILKSKSDDITGEHLVKFYQLTRKGYITTFLLEKMITEVKNSQNFYFFYPWLIDLKKISTTQSTTEIIQLCRDFKKEKETHLLLKHLRIQKLVLCRQQALEFIGNNILKNNTIESHELEFVTGTLRPFVKGLSKKHFIYFMNNIKTKYEIHSMLSKVVKSYLKTNKTPLTSELISSLEIDSDFSRYVQQKGLKDSRLRQISERELYKMIRSIYEAIENKDSNEKITAQIEKMIEFSKIEEVALPLSFVQTKLNDIGKSLQRNGYEDLAETLFKNNVRSTAIDVKEDSLFYWSWRFLRSGSYKFALEIFDKNNALDAWEKLSDPRLKFWIAYSYESLENLSLASKIYSHIISNHPLSYYSILSTKRLNTFENDSTVKDFYMNAAQNTNWTLSENDFEKDHISALIRIQVWGKLNMKKFLTKEMVSLLETNNHFNQEKSSDLFVLTSKIIAQNMNYLDSFKVIYRGLDLSKLKFNRNTMEVLYPKLYVKEIEASLKKEKIDPLIVLSLIRQESVFNPEAKSIVGARGLMQLMPQTARRLKKYVRDHQLKNPKINIELGTKYVSSLFKKFDHNLVYILASYNAGEARVKKWQGSYFNNDSILHNVESIPFLETRNYVKLIFRNIFFYKLLEDKKELVDPVHLNHIYDVSLGFAR